MSNSHLPPQGQGQTPSATLAVIIPHYADNDRLERCLTALAEQDLSGVEIILIDNATPGGLGEIPMAFPMVRVLTEPKKGAAAARNRGVIETTTPWLAFLDADCLPAPDWLDRLRHITGGDPNTVTGGRVDVFDETPPPRSGAEAFETVFAFDQEYYIRDKNFSVTANLVASRAVLEATGPFRGGLSEDVDWCRRAVAAGYRLIYDTHLRVGHPTRSDWPALARKWRRLIIEEYGLRAGRRRLSWGLKALAMLPSIVAHMPKIFIDKTLKPKDKIRAALILIRLRSMRMIWMLQLLARR